MRKGKGMNTEPKLTLKETSMIIAIMLVWLGFLAWKVWGGG